MHFARLAVITLLGASAAAQPAKRALLIGIDDYTASTLPVVSVVERRGWPDLRGATNDVRILADMLVLRYGFARANIVTLTNQQATRTAILRAIDEHLVRPSRNGDIVFYYFAGHGAQVPNAGSDEPDHLDESIVPADSRRGADDIRDKELRPYFNRILARGARLTLLLDHCHSAGGFRGSWNGARPRGIAPAPPIVDRRDYGPRPDERGALVLASTQDYDTAWETRGEDGLMHGAFTWAWIRAMRDSVSGEAAQDIFLRAQARLRGETPYQTPVLFGNADAKGRSFLGTSSPQRSARAHIAIESVGASGDVVLQGGWANGLAIGTELHPIDDRATSLRVTRLLGLGRSIARVTSTDARALRAGALLEIARQAAPRNAWFHLTSPGPPAPYHLAVRDEKTRQLVENSIVFGNRVYSIVLRAMQPTSETFLARYYYVFVIDSHGNSRLVFPKTGSAENRFPLGVPAPEIALGNPSAFRIVRPYGPDTYVLLSTEEPLPNPSILAWDDVRAARFLATTPWSIERITVESVAPPRRRASAVRTAPRGRGSR